MYYNAAIEKTFVQLASCFRHRASVKFAKSNIEDAIKDCGEALKYDPKYSKAFLQRSICYLQRGDFKEAQDDINKAMEVDPMDSQIQQHMQRVTAVIQSKQTAEAAKKKKSWTEAFEAYKIVASICCSSVQMQLEFAEMALQTNNAKEASAAVRVLMEREPGNSEALWMQAQIKYQLAADLSEVMESLKAVLKIDPNHNGASELKKKIEKSKQLRQKGNEAFQAKNYEEAVATYSELLADEDKKAPNAQNCVIYANRGLAHKQLNNFDKAVEDLSTAIERNSNYVKAYIRRAECYMAIQLWEEADRDYASLCALEPFNNDYIAKRQMIQQKINEQKSRNYYEVMGLPPFAPLPDVKKAYRLLALRYHPDKVASSGISPLKAAHLFKEIQFCNEILSDPQKKEQYDKELL
uniref:J domain-containing protein n=1 Tax=Arcella intermedia TaxID=1963864 RepID=A0A6B2L4K3_9EUKA